MEVESAPDEGSVFRFELELALVGEQTAAPFCGFLESKRILVVDDREEARMILEEMLASCNMRVELASGGEEAIEKVLNAYRSGEPFEIILMDWKMPGINGLEASRKIRELAGSGDLERETPSILMVSAYNLEDVGIGEDENIDFIPKPVTASALFEALTRAVTGAPVNHDTVSVQSARIKAPFFSGLRVLLVEDNELNQEVAYNLLIQTQADVDIAKNGVEAVSMVEEQSYDMIFMDLQMPEMDGYEATRIIRKSNPNMPIIALTAGVMQEDRKRAQEAGLNEHLTKPIQTEELYHTMLTYAPAGSVVTGAGSAGNHIPNTTDKSIFPADMPGFDVPAGIEISGGNSDFYLKMLFKYQGQLEQLYTGALDAIEALQRGPETKSQELSKQAAVAVHTLKGVAGNMAAVSLQQAAAELEKQIKSGQVPASVVIASLKDAYEEVSRGFAYLDTVHAPTPEGVNEGAASHAEETDLAYARETYSRLRAGEMLEDDEVERLLHSLPATTGINQRETLFRSIDDLNYDEAASALADILEATKGE